VATKKTPIRRATARKPASSTRAKTRKPVAKKIAKPLAKPARAAAAKKPAAKRSSNVIVVSKRPAAIAGSIQRIARRAVFIDVENTSSEDDLFEVIEALSIDRGAQPTEVNAVGNWRAISQRTRPPPGGIGAQLVHSAPPPA
jgi:hypothetical protein